jgi:hypothetical protein
MPIKECTKDIGIDKIAYLVNGNYIQVFVYSIFYFIDIKCTMKGNENKVT